MNFNRLFEAEKDRFAAEWIELLRFPSISAAAEHDKDCTACAEWLRTHMENAGFSARIEKTAGKPIVVAQFEGCKAKPSVLVYGHYDVQPVDPVDSWTTPPFEPALRNGRLYARGAEDNKGQFFYVIKALEVLIRQQKLVSPVTVILEGEEEFGGSRALSTFIKKHASRLKADILMVTDVGRVPSLEPTVIMGLRGIIAMTVELTGPSYDLHSGMHGGIAPNPAAGMARLIASLHNPDGSIAVEGFHRGIRPVSEQEKNLAATTPFDPEEYKRQTGVLPVSGEKEFSPVERVGFRPTIEVNGIHSGYGGPGGKTIIPSTATAKISSRLVADQDPMEALDAICRHLENHAPEGLQLEISDKLDGGPPLRIDPESAPVKHAASVLKKTTGQDPVYYYEGASIPIIPELSAAAGALPVLVGFGCQEDRAHAPDESFSMDQFKAGFLYACEFFSGL